MDCCYMEIEAVLFAPLVNFFIVVVSISSFSFLSSSLEWNDLISQN
jgi:hypothetical protein